MIFVTVGTHEQQFDRLLKEIDRLVEKRVITEEVFIQTGYSTYEPKYCEWSKMVSSKKMDQMVKNARIIITHGGPASFIAPLKIGKIPIVVPRLFEYNEHVNNHQLDFTKQVSKRMKNIIPIYDIKDLEKSILNYEVSCAKLKKNNVSNNKAFCEELARIVNSLFEKEI